MGRRNFFLTTAAAAAASTTVFGSPNDTIRVATIGLRGRGKDHIKEITGQPNVELVALCDIDQKVLDAAASNVETITRKKPAIYTDYRKLLEDKSIDAIYLPRGLCYKWRDTIGTKAVSDPPSYVDYDLWQGPAQKVPFKENRFHYNWHWYWAYGNGDLGNQGIHEVDIARWGLGVKFPTKASAVGGNFMFDDDQETPNPLNCAFEFNENGKKQMMEFEVRHWMSNHEAGIAEGGKDSNTIGNVFYGSKGYLAIAGPP